MVLKWQLAIATVERKFGAKETVVVVVIAARRDQNARGLFLVAHQLSAITVQTLNVEGAVIFW